MEPGTLIKWNGGGREKVGLLVYKTDKDYGVDTQTWNWDRNGKPYTHTERIVFTHAELERLDPRPLV